MKLCGLLALAVTSLASQISLPAYPLAVKSPYLSSWLRYNQSTDVPSATPIFWTGEPLTWQIMARVNDHAYCLFGCANSALKMARQIDISFTSTRTLITLEAGSAQFLLEFFSPVSLTDYVRQSIPYSYLNIDVTLNPSMSTIDILTAIDDTWTSQQPNTQVDLLKSDNGSLIFSLGGKSSYTWAENSDMAAWGLVNLAADTNTANKVTFQAGSANDIATRFKENGTLNDEYASYQSGDLVALAYHISTPRSKSSSTSVTFAIGLEQDNAFNWLGEPQTGYYQATISGTENVVDHFFADAFTADAEGIVLDKRITDIGAEISSNYSDILESTIRQIWGGFQILIPQASKDTTMAKAWMKEISTDGNVQTVADLLPKSFPVFYTLAPDYMRLLLKPLMEYSLVWPAEFGFHDLGKHYPNATGETVATEEALIVDQTSVLLWMAYAYQRASKNTEWVKPYISALTKFADYLVNNGLYPAKQMSSTDSITPTANQTILAMYAAIGLTSFGALTEQSNYTAIGKNFTSVILKLGTDSNDTHIIAHYGDPDTSWISTYPFAFDKMLGLNTFNETTYEMQSIWYEGQLHPYGIPFYSGVDYTVAEFMAWCAATSSQSVSEALINGIYAFLADGMNNVPGPTVWYVTGSQSGEWDSSIAKSTCGSYFMPLAVNMHQKA